MISHFLTGEELQAAVKQSGFAVEALAAHLGMGVRTLERRFAEHFQMSPKAWILRERVNAAQVLLAKGLSNKEVAASLGYAFESNFCREFKRLLGTTPQSFARAR